MRVLRTILLAVFSAQLLSGCLVPAPQRLGPDGPLPEVRWTAEEQIRAVATRPVRERDGVRVVLVRLLTAESPHDHPDEDLTVFILSGSGNMHFEDRSFPFRAGDVIEVPAGAQHWAENTSSSASLAYAVFHPVNR